MAGLLGSGSTITPPTPMASYAINHNGFFTLTLQNGEVWQQNDGDSNMSNWHKPAASYIVTVTAGAVGSSNMEVKGEAAFYKVKRLR